jgi:NDP-sugar pyrophosphorylase family protein
MKDIVIAAGYATRLGELTKNFPKPLLKIGENTILGRMLDDIDRIPEIDEHIKESLGCTTILYLSEKGFGLGTSLC